MNWIDFNFSFRQQYDRGYRYLDRFGEFLVEAETNHGFMPNDIKPIGGNLQLPEECIDVQIDSASLNVSQENPKLEILLDKTKILTDLVLKYFEPVNIEMNVVNLKSYWPIHSIDELAKTLKVSEMFFKKEEKPDFDVLADAIGMIPVYRNDSFAFKSGSKDLVVNLNTFTFTSTQKKNFNAVINSTEREQKRISRINARTARFVEPPPYGFMLEIVLREEKPPESGFDSLFENAMKKLGILKELYKL
ncbi:MAG: hypothetical protein WCS96_00220 [Victivallales bacterium]